MKYMLLLRHEPETGPAEGTPEFDAEMASWGEVMGELAQAGSMVAAHGLDTEATATTVRIRNDEALVSDGPFAETKESFFSYIIIDVADLDAALGWAKKMPNATYGSVEVRPLSSHEQDA
ncbi:YciI family protein [Nocardioides marmoriginsengisoli]|uniref:YciI family protein n=1 Tax=Nocardioides marmoriginsengisoli TaxID=661483 RepID=A0A3N0CBP7_9ACTN|nr:YciI family protein [Nocardioides marmoriginsengisoli]RNL60403.1 YciI family protein [Nocardioides marmoriginsengisoli]